MEAPGIPGAHQVIGWFGQWPSFHDAEVVSITLNRSGESSVLVHAFENTREVDAHGRFVLTKHAMVTFHCEDWPLDGEGISNTHLDFFNAQNVLSSLVVNKVAQGWEIVLNTVYGVDGVITTERLSVTLEPGIPAGSIYAR
jgi:hypothetical protein